METLQNNSLPYPKLRNLNSIMKNKLDMPKINPILRYLERSKKIEIDLDGNIIWMGRQENKKASLADKATFSSEFMDHLKSRHINLESGD